jgi:hypothetical protein
MPMMVVDFFRGRSQIFPDSPGMTGLPNRLNTDEKRMAVVVSGGKSISIFGLGKNCNAIGNVIWKKCA